MVKYPRCIYRIALVLMGLELDIVIVLETIKVFLDHNIADLDLIFVSETHWPLDRDVLPVCVNACLLLFPGLAPPLHQVRAAGSPHAGLLAWWSQQ